MASRGFFDFAADRSSPVSSYGSDSQVFHSPRSLSPQDDIIHRENTEASEILVTHENHYGTCTPPAAANQDERSMSLHFIGSSSSFELEQVSVWRRIRNVAKKVKPWFFFLLGVTIAVFVQYNHATDCIHSHGAEVFFAINEEDKTDSGKLLAISHSYPVYFELVGKTDAVVTVKVSGPFVDLDEDEGPEVSSEHNLTIALISRNDNVTKLVVHEVARINCSSTTSDKRQKVIDVEKTLKLSVTEKVTHLMLALNTSYPIAVSVKYYVESHYDQVIIAAFVILVGVYVLIIFELVHRATAAMLGSLAALCVLSYIDKRPSLKTVLTWVEWETLSLLFGMMILVAVFAKTGFFDYVALKAYKLSRGHVWWLITLLCACTALISAVLDNVTVILLFTPVTVTLCQVLNLNPTPILIAEVVFSNIGGTATAIGDPPNVILVSDEDLGANGINFADFTNHLIGGIFICLLVAYLVLRLLYRNVKLVKDDPPIIEEMKREAEIWKRSADRLLVFTAQEKTVKLLLMQKAMQLENTIRNMKRETTRREAFQRSLQELERKYIIRDKELLMKSSLVICAVIVLFFIHSGVSGLELGIGWIAMLGAILLILLADITQFEDLMEQVEWTTLVFFSGLFILMHSLKELGLMDYLGNKTSTLIEDLAHGCSKKSELGIAIIVIVWVAALASSFIDNIPFTTAMIPVVLELQKKNDLDLKPLVWALAMGACLGGNGTLIGASANVVCAGLAEQYGYPITFNSFFKVGFLIMLATTATATVYLLIFQVLLH